jgi:hypothetical protein
MDENQTKQLVSGTVPAPKIKVVEGGVLAPEIESEEDHDHWHSLLAGSFGVEDRTLASALMVQLVRGSQDLRKGGVEMANGAIAAIGEMRPQGAVEALLAVQMAALHNQCMQMMVEATRASSPEKKGAYLNLALKLSRAYANSMDSLRKYQQKGQQKMTVEHVHVHNGGQAIVGSVTNAAKGEDSR